MTDELPTYLLAVLTHGADIHDERLGQTLNSFYARVKPEPVDTIVLADDTAPIFPQGLAPEYLKLPAYTMTGRQLGFCGATRHLWQIASNVNTALYSYVFWLEHDFVFLRDVDLADVVAEMDLGLAQMAFMRTAVNPTEKAAGGLYESRRSEYELRGLHHPWLEHRSYFTTNPSIMRREFMQRNPWPAYVSECEGRFGLDLVGDGYRFGAWGTGEAWVSHIGERIGGHGY